MFQKPIDSWNCVERHISGSNAGYSGSHAVTREVDHARLPAELSSKHRVHELPCGQVHIVEAAA